MYTLMNEYISIMMYMVQTCLYYVQTCMYCFSPIQVISGFQITQRQRPVDSEALEANRNLRVAQAAASQAY
jgi:hypothetical protein